MKLLVGGLLIAAIASAQSFQGSLRGRVLDPQGAAVNPATLSLTDEATSVSRRTITNSEGEYVFSAVNPSTYAISAEAPGFKRLEHRGVLVSTQTAVTVDLALQLGQISEQVNVTAETPALSTADASTGQVIDSQKILNLPILGRNTFFTAKLAETVVLVGNPKFNRMQDQNGNSQVSIAGGPVRTNNYLVDGISITDATNRAVILPSPEAVSEMKLQASTYDAEVGRTGGGTFNTLLRSGSNEWHGSAVGYIRQTDWLANTFFANRSGQPVADQPFRNWAASFGGPIRIPKLFDGSNKTFFFLATEAYRQKDAASTTLSVPTALERKGDFSQTFTRAGGQQVIYDPLTTAADGSRTAFAGNVIPANRLNSAGVALASYYPLPNTATPYYAAPNFNVTVSNPNRGDQFTSKVNHQLFPWVQVSASYIHQKTFETSSQWFGNIASPNQGLLYRKVDATQANATITPQATTVIALRWGFNRFYSRTAPASAGFDLNSVGLGAMAGITSNPAFPAITMGGAVSGCGSGTSGDYSNFGGGCTNQDVWYSRSFNATVSKFVGRHSLKAGFDYRTLNDAGTPASGPTSLGFTDVFTRSRPQASTVGTGSSLATLLLGFPTSGQMTVTTTFNDFVRYWGFFVQDDFRVTPKLTINFGPRFEHGSGVQEVNNKLITGFDPAAANPIQQNLADFKVNGVVQYAGTNGTSTQSGRPLGVKLGPRLGFAYSLNDKTVLRGGYGIYWAPASFVLQNTLGYSQNTTILASQNNNFTPSATLTNPYPSGLLQPSDSSLGALSGIGQAITVLDPNAESGGYVQQYSFDVQRHAVKGLVVTVGVLGSHTLHLTQTGQNVGQLNPAFLSLGSALSQSVANPFFNKGGVGSVGTATVSRSQLLLPFPQYSSVTLANSDSATTRYYAAYIRVQRQFSAGISVLASYTRSRSMDNIFGLSGVTGNSQSLSTSGPQNAYDLNGEWGLSTQDVPDRFTTALTWELPFGKGKHGLTKWAAAGWSVNAVGLVQSGYPMIVQQPNNNSVIGASYQRPNATGISPRTAGSTVERINGWINPAAFSQSAQFTFGNTSRTLDLRGPGIFNWDVSVFKTFTIRERLRAQFRAEALNATNTVYFGAPNLTYTSSTFGVITSQANNPRLIQLGARFSF
jgi:hypothetical protein